MDLSTPRKSVVGFGLYEVDMQEHLLSKGGRRVRLQEQPFQVLALLLKRPGEVVTREELRGELWPADTFVEFDAGLNNAIKKLRSALSDAADNPRFIETVPRRGYRFLAPVHYPVPDTQDTQIDLGNRARMFYGGAVRTASSPSQLREDRRARARWVSAAAICLTLLLGVALAGIAKNTQFGQRVIKDFAQTTGIKAGAAHRIDPRAHGEYLQARHYWVLRTAESISKAAEHFEQAIVIDPNYAEAYAGLANCYVVLPMLSSLPYEGSYQKARRAAEEAIRLDGNLSEAHLAAAEIKLYSDWDFLGAEREFKRTLQLDGTYAQAHQWYAEYLSLMGRHSEAIGEIDAAQQLDPSSMIIYHQAGQTLQAAHRYDDALREYRRALQIQPGYGPTYSAMAIAYRRQKRYLESLEAERQANSYWDPGGTASHDRESIAKAYSASGERGFLLATLGFNKKHPGPAYYLAWDYSLLGRNDEAFQSLQTSLQHHEPEILGLRNDPELDRLRSDPRFKALMNRVGLAKHPA